MTSTQAYRNYNRIAIFAALRGNYDFEADYAAYRALAAGDVDKLVVMATGRRKRLGVKPSQVKFHKRDSSPKSWKSAVQNYDAAKGAYYVEQASAIVKVAPMHLTKTTGKQGDKKRDGNLIAHYSIKRPKKVQSVFGEADYSEVFDA